MRVRKTTIEVREYESAVFEQDPKIVEAIETDYLRDEDSDNKEGAVTCIHGVAFCDFQKALTEANNQGVLLSFLENTQIDSIQDGRLRRLVAAFQFALRQLKKAADGRV